nr:dual specificity protein phosphatase 12 isoform X2 [Solanum lycopersicum]
MPYLVRDHLFIGNIGDAAEVLQHGSDEITHILSVLSSTSISFFSEWRSGISIPTKEIRKEYVGYSGNADAISDETKSSSTPKKLLYLLENAGKDLKFIRMAVPLRDMENENLLDSLDVCLDFIKESRKEGSVLVHCFAGVSRSAAIITAYLMKTEQLSQEGDCYNRGERIDTSKFGADPGLAAENISSDVDVSLSKETTSARTYRCKKCRRVVALQGNVVDHVPGEGETAFEWHKRRSGNPYNKPDDECSSVFVEPLKWMRTVEEGAMEGKLLCAHCEARLGYFNWSGIQCSCGSWITPAFQLHKSRVDISSM